MFKVPPSTIHQQSAIDSARFVHSKSLWPRRVAILMTAVAGFVDAVGYLVLAHVFLANMSGNSIAIGMDGADLHWRSFEHRGLPIVAFLIGLLLGGFLTAEHGNRTAQRRLGRILLMEAVLLVVFAGYGGVVLGWLGPPRQVKLPNMILLTTLGGVAMGLQNVSLRASGTLNVYTTHVTGALTELADDAVKYGLWMRRLSLHNIARGRPWFRSFGVSRKHPALRKMIFLACVWCAYVAGAANGALALRYWGFIAMTIPTLVLATLAISELCRPQGSLK